MTQVHKLCFLCFQNSKSESPSSNINEEETSQFKTVSLQSVLHYINSEGDDDCGGGGDQVVVCQDCYNVASKLSCLCVRLQEIQLNIEYYLQQFSDKLNGQGEPRGRKESWNEQALKLYRKHIYQKCRNKLKNKRQPVIPLEKLTTVPEPAPAPLSQNEEWVKEEDGDSPPASLGPPPTLDIEPPPASPLEEDPLAEDTDNLLEEEIPTSSIQLDFFEEEPVTSLIVKPPSSSIINEIFEDNQFEPFENSGADVEDDQFDDEESIPVLDQPMPFENVGAEIDSEQNNLDESLESPPVLTQEVYSPSKLNKKRKRGRPRVHPPNLFKNSGRSPIKSKDGRINRKGYTDTATNLNVEPCQTCGAEFSCKWERRNHMYTHRLPRTLGLKDSSANKVKCPNCTNRITWVRGGDSQLLLHNYNFHLDLVFKSSKQADIHTNQFADYCKHLFNCEGLHSKVEDKNGSSPTFQGYKCQYCGKAFKTFASLRSHLISKHKPIISRKLKELQRDISADKLKEVMCPPVRDDNRCEQCGATFSKYGGLNRHLKESCPFRKDKSVKSHRPCKCQECGMRFGVTVSFYRHRRNEHPNSIKPPILLK